MTETGVPGGVDMTMQGLEWSNDQGELELDERLLVSRTRRVGFIYTPEGEGLVVQETVDLGTHA
jgi:hypothetical protein